MSFNFPEEPEFNSTWDDVYECWLQACRERDVEPTLDTFLEVKFEHDIAFYKDLDWIPMAKANRFMGPKVVHHKGYAFYEPHCNPAALTTIELLVRSFENNEDFACVCILTCAYQLELQRDVRWKDYRSECLLKHIHRLCDNRLFGWPGLIWQGSPKRIFPERFFSKRLLETLPSLTERTVVDLALSNIQYYLSQWIIVKYRYPTDRLESFLRRQDEVAARLFDYIISDAEENATPLHEETTALPKEISSTAIETKLLILDRAPQRSYVEGSRKSVTHDRIEQNPHARKACLNHYGAVCQVCGIDFEKRYGPQFAGLIDVHHISPMSETAGQREVDPVRDLVPLCPNCHRMIHRKPHGVYSVEELKCLVNGSVDDG